MGCLFVSFVLVKDMTALCHAFGSLEANTAWNDTRAAGLEPGCGKLSIIHCKARTSHCRVSLTFPSRYSHGLSCPAFLTSHTDNEQAGV